MKIIISNKIWLHSADDDDDDDDEKVCCVVSWRTEKINN
jgi:hypothetical protein